MLLRKSSRPNAARQILQWFRFSDSSERVAQYGFDEVERAQRCFSIRFDPVSKILAELGMKDRRALLRQGDLFQIETEVGAKLVERLRAQLP